jgi:hypothetical protein
MPVRFVLRYVSVYSWGLEIWVSSTSFQKSKKEYQPEFHISVKIWISDDPYDSTKEDQYWSNHQDQEVFWGNRAVEAACWGQWGCRGCWGQWGKSLLRTSVILVLEFNNMRTKIFYFDVLKEFFFWQDHENSCWILASFLSQAVEASLWYFFKNWLMKHKFPNLRNLQVPSNKI